VKVERHEETYGGEKEEAPPKGTFEDLKFPRKRVTLKEKGNTGRRGVRGKKGKIVSKVFVWKKMPNQKDPRRVNTVSKVPRERSFKTENWFVKRRE